jgi:hypothetical protein
MESNKTPSAACLVVKVQLSGGGVAASVIMTGRRRCVRMVVAAAAAAVGCVSLTSQIGVLIHATGENRQIYIRKQILKGLSHELDWASDEIHRHI